MDIEQILKQTVCFAEEIEAFFPPMTRTPNLRHISSSVACSLALEHWDATKILLSQGLFPSAVTVHRTQFEALVRSIWLLYAASDTEVGKLISNLNTETEQSSKNVAGLQEMISEIGKKGPTEAYKALVLFRDNGLKPINSYVHTGIHPIYRHANGYPAKLMGDVLRNSNGIALMTWMQESILVGQPEIQLKILDVAARYPTCMPDPLEK